MVTKRLPPNPARQLLGQVSPLEQATEAARVTGPTSSRATQIPAIADHFETQREDFGRLPVESSVPLPSIRHLLPSAPGAAKQKVIESIEKHLSVAYSITNLDAPVAQAVAALHEVDKTWATIARYPDLWSGERRILLITNSENALVKFDAAISYLSPSGETALLTDSRKVLEYMFKLAEKGMRTNVDHIGSAIFGHCKLSRELLKRVAAAPQPTNTSSSLSYLTVKERIVQLQNNIMLLCQTLPEQFWSNRASLNTLQRIAWLGVSQKDYKDLNIKELLREHGDKQLEGHEVRSFPLQIDALGRDIERIADFGSWFALESDAQKIISQTYRWWTEAPGNVGAVVGAAVGMAGTSLGVQNACQQGAAVLCNAKGWSISASALALLSLVPPAALALATLKDDHITAEVLESEGFVPRENLSGRDFPDLAAMRSRARRVGYRVTDTDRNLLAARQGARELDAEAAKVGVAVTQNTLVVGASVAAATWGYYTQTSACASVALAVECARHAGALSCGTGAIVACETGSILVVGGAFAGTLALYGGVRAFFDPGMRDLVSTLMNNGISAADIAAQIKCTRPPWTTLRGILSAPLVAVGYGFTAVGERRILRWQH